MFFMFNKHSVAAVWKEKGVVGELSFKSGGVVKVNIH